MHTWKDEQDNKWTIELNVDGIRRVRSEINIDLVEVLDGKLLDKLGSDPVLLVDVLWVLHQEEAAKKDPKVDARGFAKAVAGDAIDRATEAFLEELTDFFPKRRRKRLQKVRKAANRMEEALLQIVDRKTEDPRLKKIVKKAEEDVDREFDRLAGISPESSKDARES